MVSLTLIRFSGLVFLALLDPEKRFAASFFAALRILQWRICTDFFDVVLTK
jgi:hypothetical protein